MTTSIVTNISADFSQRNLRASSVDAQSSIARLSSGNAIVRASDDVAALSVGTILRTDVSTLTTALANTAQASSVIQVADGAIERLGEILQRQKALSTQALSGALSDTERGYLNQEFQALKDEYSRIVDQTNFNGVKLLDGTLAATTTTIASEDVTVGADSIGRLRTGETLDSTVLGNNGTGTIAISNNGTTEYNTTQNKLVGSLADASVGGSLVAAATDLAQFTVTVNGVSFVSANVDLDEVQNDITFTASDGSGVAFTLDIADNTANITTGTLTQAEVTTVAQNIQAEIRKFDFYQDRVLENTAATDSSAITADKFDGTVLQGLDGGDFQLVGTAFSTADGKAPSISGFEVTSISPTLASISVNIGGVVYSTSNVTGNENGVTVDGDISGDNLGGGNGVFRLQSADDANSYLDINLLATTSAGVISLVNDTEAAGLEAALNGGFGSGATGGASFAVGTEVTDTINLTISSIATTDVYKDDSDVSQTGISVDTEANAIIASGVVDNAIQTLTSVRADVGAIQSRFEFASSTLESSLQNLDAARGQFLDADISEESTAFAQVQVLIQASISVLAQANQLPQNLLKLIG